VPAESRVGRSSGSGSSASEVLASGGSEEATKLPRNGTLASSPFHEPQLNLSFTFPLTLALTFSSP
jgi:hypothetical protein